MRARAARAGLRVAACLLAGIGRADPASGQVAPPNLVLIVADDLGWTDLGVYGSTFYETPHLDRLAGEGMRFTRAYAAAPVCSPTRASLLTGLYPARLRQTDWIPGRVDRPDQRLLQVVDHNHLPLERVTIAEALRGAGYTSASIGKWHLGGRGHLPTDQGFSLNVAGDEAGSPPGYFWPYRNAARALEELARDGAPGEELTGRLAEEAARFIAANRARPFFLYFPLFAVHNPLQAKPELIAKYEARARTLALDSASIYGREASGRVRRVQNHAVYAALVETMDAAVGRIVQALRENGVEGRTLVVFTSDNGGLSTAEGLPTSNLPLRAGKGWLYEGGVREPLIVRWPGVVAPGSSYREPVISNDLFPTFLEIAGVSAGSRTDGVSLLPAFRGRRMPERTLYWHYPHYSNQGGGQAGAILEGDLKLIESFEDGRLELYDLRADPGEQRDLSALEPARTAALRSRLQAWRASVRAQMPRPNPNFTGAPPVR